MKRLSLVCLFLAVCALTTSCGSVGGGKKPERNANKNSTEIQFAAPVEGDPIAIIVTSGGEIRVRLFPQLAPMAVENFTGLAQQGYYNNVAIHRIVKDFVVQSGDATGTGTGGNTIWNGTPYPVEISDSLHHYTGAVGIAHVSGDTASNTSQFYIVQTPQNSVDKNAAGTLTKLGMREDVVSAYRAVGGAPYLDNLYTVFAQVYEGMAVVDELAAVKCDENGQPLEPIVVESVTVTTYTAPVVASGSGAVSDTASGAEAGAASDAAASATSAASDAAASSAA